MKGYANIIISREGEKFLRNGQMWMYKNNVVSYDENLENGTLMNIISESGEYLGSGYLSKKSHITVRILSKDPNEKIDYAFFFRRFQFAYDYRKTLEGKNIFNCRMVFGEADELPGLIIDRYNDILVSQISSYGLEKNKDMIYAALLAVFDKNNEKIAGIYERNDIAIRAKEGLKQYKGYYMELDLPVTTVINENGLLLNVDVENGQKTGYFLDQKSNRYLLRMMAKDKVVMDCFSHTGGFALNAAMGGAKEVVAVDVSRTALDQALANAKLNHLEERMQFVQADVFDYLKTAPKGKYDIIVLDPPAFTKSRRTVDHAYNGYLNINANAMKLLGRGGYLITCSCSRYMEIDLFEKMLREAADLAGVTLRQVSVTQQNHDHPILWSMNESSYLKFYIFQLI